MTVVERFAADYFVVEGLTPKRQTEVRRQLRELAQHTGKAPEDCDADDIRGYMAARLNADIHVNTVRKYLNALKPFFKWCWRRQIIDAARWMQINDLEPPRGSSSHGRPRPYRAVEVRRFWDQLDARWPLLPNTRLIARYQRGTTRYRRIWRHAMHLQTQAVASLALFGGLRNSEIRWASLDEIAPENDYIVARGKSPFGERQGYREVPYTEEGRRMVADWLEFRAEVLRPDHDNPWLVLSAAATPNNPLNPSHPLKPIGDKGWENLITNVGTWELHRFRHTCATEWLRAGVEIEQVQRLLGHSNIAQTLRYAELVRDDLARGVRRAETDFVTAVGRRNQRLAPPKAA